MRRIAIAIVLLLAVFEAHAASLTPLAFPNRQIHFGQTWGSTSYPGYGHPVAVGSRWVFSASTSNGGQFVWSSDGTEAGTHAISGVAPTYDFVSTGSLAYFAAYSQSSNTTRLYRTDGTAAGTFAVGADLILQYGGYPLAALGSHVVTMAADATLWISDGTESGSRSLGTKAATGTPLVRSGNRLFFAGGNGMLWATDGTPEGTAQVAAIAPSSLGAAGNRVFFWDLAHTTFYTSDGTAAGTSAIFSLPTRHEGASAVVDIGGGVGVATVVVATHVIRVLRTDGTVAGTQLVGPAVDRIWFGLVSGGDKGFFVAYPNAANYVVWETDGTDAGTHATEFPLPYQTGRGLSVVDGQVYAAINATQFGPVLYRRTAGQWVQVPGQMPPWGKIGDRLLFADGLIAGSDGEPRPFIVPEGEPASDSACRIPFVGLGSSGLLFAASSGGSPGLTLGCELWRSDGTRAGTSRIWTPDSGMTLTAMVAAGDRATFFITAVANNTAPRRLFTTDGTAAGTREITIAGSTFSVYSGLWSGAGRMFVTDSAGALYEVTSGAATLVAPSPRTITAVMPLATGLLWLEQEGTDSVALMHLDAAGTPSALAHHASVSPGYSPAAFVSDTASIAVYSVLTRYSGGGFPPGYATYRTDGTAAGTKYVSNSLALAAVGDLAFYTANLTAGGTADLWRSDGTDAGTFIVLSDIFTPATAVSAAGVAFFTASDRNSTYGLYRSDGTVSGTRRVGGIPGYCCRNGAWAIGGSVFLLVEKASYTYPSPATQLWVSNGTSAAGTHAVDFAVPPNFEWVTPPLAAMESLFGMVSTGEGMNPHRISFDSDPDLVSIPDATNIAIARPVFSQPTLVTGLEVSAPVTVTNGSFCVSSGPSCSCDVAPLATQGRVNNQQYLCASHTSASSPGASVTSTLTIGGHATSFRSITGTDNRLSVTLAGSGRGRVRSSDGGLDCPGTCAMALGSTATVTLTAQPRVGDRFAGWSGGACSGTGACTVTVNGPIAVTALFVASVNAVRGTDLDGDGLADFLWHQPNGSQGAWLGSGGGYQPFTTLAPPAPGATIAMTGDFNGDGQTDLLWVTPSNGYFVTLMNGLSVIASAQIFQGASVLVTGKGDFDGDGKTDLLYRQNGASFGDSTHGVALMDGTAQTLHTIASLYFSTATPLVADFNGDGKSDLVLQSDGSTWIYLLDGGSVLESRQVLGSGTGWTAAFAGDLDGDGKADLVWQHTDGRHGAWFMNGTTAASYASLLGANTGWRLRFLRDLDGDGTADLIWSHDSGGWAGWLMGNGSPKAYASFLGPNTGWVIVASHDYDGDGKDDLLWRSAITGQYGLWLMDGLGAKAYRSILDGGSGWDLVP